MSTNEPDMLCETPRLILRRFRASDAEALHGWRSDPDTARYQGWDPPTLEEARAFVAAQADATPGASGAAAQIAVQRKADGAVLGDVFLDTPDEPADEARIGFTLAREHRGQGFATEAVEGLLAFVFGRLGKRRVTALTFADNARSVALLERVGMRREAHHVRSSPFEGDFADDYTYALLREEWEARGTAPSP